MLISEVSLSVICVVSVDCACASIPAIDGIKEQHCVSSVCTYLHCIYQWSTCNNGTINYTNKPYVRHDVPSCASKPVCAKTNIDDFNDG